MTDTTLSGAASHSVFDSSRQTPSISPVDAAALSPFPAAARAPTAPPESPTSLTGDNTPASTDAGLLSRGRLRLDADALRGLRETRLLSQQDLADECWRRNIQVSIATIKRAELGYAVRFRIARELARCFDVPVARLLMPSHMENLKMDMDQHDGLLAAVRDTLMHIAGVSVTAAKRLRPGQSLDADLGFEYPDFAVLAAYQNEVALRLRGNGTAYRLNTDNLRDCVVWEVCALTVKHAVGRELGLDAVAALIGQAQAGLRSGV